MKPFVRNVENWPTCLKNFAMFTRQDLKKYVWRFFNIMNEKIEERNYSPHPAR